MWKMERIVESSAEVLCALAHNRLQVKEGDVVRDVILLDHSWDRRGFSGHVNAAKLLGPVRPDVMYWAITIYVMD